MNIRNLSWFLGLNVAAACVLMQGCKANKAHMGGKAAASAVVVEPAPQPQEVPTVAVATPPPAEPVVTIAPEPPPAVPEVKKLPPPPPPKKTPAAKPVSPAPAADAGKATVHVVQKGEVLSRISRKYNVKMGAIIAANPGIDPNRIRIGQKLTIPGAAAKAAEKKAPEKKADAPKAAAPEKKSDAAKATAANVKAPAVKAKAPAKHEPYTGATKEYEVKSGDTLGHIAVKHGTTVKTIKEINGLSKDNLSIGQKLKVPAEKQAKEEEKKDAPKQEATKPAAKPEEKKQEVKKSAETVEAAASIEEVAPAAATPADDKKAAPAADTPATVTVESVKPAASGRTHVVKEGEDMVAISISYGVGPSQLMDLNNIAPGEQLKPGRVLKLPEPAKAGN